MVQDKVYIKRALVSCYDKSGLQDLAGMLKKMPEPVEVLSSGGTAKSLKDLGIPAIEVSDFTRYRESPDGLVKTLQPKIHGGILLDPSNPAHEWYMVLQGIVPIDLVVVNLYPFQETAMRSESTFEECREKIDIGGPAMLRSAAKNFLRVAAITDWEDLKAFRTDSKGAFTYLEDRMQLATKVFAHTQAFDKAVVEYLQRQNISSVASKYLAGIK